MLELRHVSCRYDDHFVLKDINVRIEDGGLVGVIGPNGSGKTTLIRAVTRTIKLAEGEVLLKGEKLDTLSFKELAQQVAVVGRLYDLDVRMRVEDLVLLGRIPHRKGLRLMERRSDLGAAEEAMDLTGTLSLRSRFVDSLSSGERQLAFIARALAQEPELLLLDEPTSHLDIGHQARVLDLVRKLNRDRGLTVLVVLHDLNLASQYCDRIFLLSDGVLWKDGTPDEVLTYRNIEEVYHTPVVVMKNPVSSRPGVFLVPEEDIVTGAK
jgi:iron complex transport system ATP-binding protein